MSKIWDLVNQVNTAIAEWEAADPDDIEEKAKDKFQYFEIIMAEVVEEWYQETKKILANKGPHGLGVMKEVFKTYVMIGAKSLRDDKSGDDKDFVKAHIVYQAGKLYQYAKSVQRGKKCRT